MTQTTLRTYRRKLLALGQRLNQDLTKVEHEALRMSGGEASGNLSNAPLHPADLGNDQFEQEVSLGLLENEQHLFHQITAALQRIEDGTYGPCLECGQEIARARLEALPYAAHCLTCAQEMEMYAPARIAYGNF